MKLKNVEVLSDIYTEDFEVVSSTTDEVSNDELLDIVSSPELLEEIDSILLRNIDFESTGTYNDMARDGVDFDCSAGNNYYVIKGVVRVDFRYHNVYSPETFTHPDNSEFELYDLSFVLECRDIYSEDQDGVQKFIKPFEVEAKLQ